MLLVGSLLALVCGLANSAAAVLEKREMVRDDPRVRGPRVLLALARRPTWIAAMILSEAAWVAEALALALAPVPVVATLRVLGRGGLVLAGRRWLGEQFGRVELAGIALLLLGGILTAVSVASSTGAQPPLSALREVAVAAAAVLLAGLLSRRGGGARSGAAVGVLFAATGVFTKEIGDRVIRHGLAGLPPLLATPGPWMMIALTVWALSLLQHAFARANAATVSAASTTVSSTGLIIAGTVLYHEPLASGLDVIPLALGLAASAAGAILVAIHGSVTAAPIHS
jgi:multidrug transporter EmrE-like cation transporter